MIVKLSRLFILLVVIFVASITLPHYYKISFGNRIVTPMINYSPVTEDFLISEYGNKKFFWKDRQGNTYSHSEADKLMPLANYRVLLGKGIMPDSIQGIKIDIDTLRVNNLFTRLRPKEIDAPGINMFPLFESKPPRFKLTMPTNYFGVNNRMEFIDAESNKVVEQLTASFTNALTDIGFAFPGKKFFGNPTTRKAFDEGYFIIDALGKLFHVKKINGQPYCKNISLPDDFAVRHMIVYENSLREFYGLIVNDNNEIFLLLYDQYKLKKLPVESYDALNDQMIFRGNIFYRQVNVVKDSKIKTFVMDRNYETVAFYEDDIPKRYSATAAMIQKVLFPFTLSLSKSTSYFVGFHFSTYSCIALILNILLMAALLFFKRYRTKSVLNKWYDFAIVLVTGIYGFIAVLVYENTDL